MSCRKNGHKNIFSVWYYFFGCTSYPLCSFLSLVWLTFFGFRVTYFLNHAIGVWFWMYMELGLRILIVQEQPSRVVFKKRCSENMQQIYRRIPIPKCDFNKVASQLYWNRILAWLFSCKFAANFQNTFPKNTSGRLLPNSFVAFYDLFCEKVIKIFEQLKPFKVINWQSEFAFWSYFWPLFFLFVHIFL